MRRARKSWALSTAIGLLLALSGAPASADTTCPSVGQAWAETGPFKVTTTPSGQGYTIFHPAELGSPGCTYCGAPEWSRFERNAKAESAP